MSLGLVPFYFTSYEEQPGPIYLAKKKPSSKISSMNPYPSPENRILDDYMLMSSYKHGECHLFNLYEIDTTTLDPNLFRKTSDKREITYLGTIPPENIKLIKQYETSVINEHYLRATTPWWA